MRKTTLIYLLICICAGSISCNNDKGAKLEGRSKEKFSASEKPSNIISPNDKLFSVERTIGNMNYEVTWLSSRLLAERQLGKNAGEKKLAELINVLDSFQVYVFRISCFDYDNELIKMGVHEGEDYKKRVEYYSFNVNKEFMLFDGDDTLKCLMTNFERTYGADPFITITTYFKNQKFRSSSTRIFEFNDIVYGSGLLRFRFEKNNSDMINQNDLI